MHFDAEAMLYPEEIAAYVEHLGMPLCIIGEAGNQHVTLLMDPEGKVYGASEDVLMLWGETGEQAIENLIRGQSIKRLMG